MDTRDVAYRRSWRDYAAGMLRGAGQVMLQESWLSGVLFCAGLLWGCFGPGASCPTMLVLGGLAGLAIATCVGYLCGKVSDADRGLYGFNGMLAGCALGALAGNGTATWGAIAVASVLTLVLRRWLERRMQPLGLSSYTAPFIIAVWLTLMAARAAGLWEPAEAGIMPCHITISPWSLVECLLNGISQVFLVESWGTGVLFLAGLAVSSRRAALWALASSAIGSALAAAFGASPAMVMAGIYGFSPVLTGIAIGAMRCGRSAAGTAWGVAAVAATVPVQMVMEWLLAPTELPVLTAPFCIASWVFAVMLAPASSSASQE